MGGDDYAARRGSARLPIRAPVNIRFPGVDDAYEGTVGDIGMAGMFIAGSTPMPAGTLMHFDFRPSPQWHKLSGRARIVWARQEPSAKGEPAGMGVRFIELDARGRRGVRWLIETYQAVGDKPFETWSVPSQFTRSKPARSGDVLATQEIVPIPPTPTERPAWLRQPWPLLAAGLVAVILISGWALLDDSEDSGTGAETRQIAAVDDADPRATIDEEADAPQTAAPESAPEAVAATSPPATAPVTDPEASEAVSTEASETVSAVLADLVDEWAAAWSSQDLDRYLAFYAPEFVPESGISRAAWARQRAGRLAAPEFIRVGVDAVQVIDGSSATPRVVFTQAYESNTFSDQVTKSLTWTRSQGTWRIVSERSAP